MRILALLLVLVMLLSACQSVDTRKRNAQYEYEKGMRLYDRFELEAAKKAFEDALWYNPKHEGAKKYLNVVKRMLGMPVEVEVE
jgi:tetratricopeptide (TPR) repeat protein